MNAKTLEAITRHGESLLRAFPNCTEKNPVALCKKLRRIENSVAPIILRNCNEGVPEAELDAATDKARSRVIVLLGITDAVTADAIHINRDPRGHALKLSSEWAAEYNQAARKLPRCCKCGGDVLCSAHSRFNGRALKAWRERNKPIYTDWGGYGILAPDLTAD